MSQAQPFYFFLSALLFVVIFYWPWQRLCVEWSRQLMFEERDKLFLLARSSSELTLDSDLHVEVRTLIDNSIRFCHKITWQRLLLTHLGRFKSRAPHRAANIANLMDQLKDKQTGVEFHGIIRRISFACIVCMMGRSMFLGPLFLFLYFGAIVRDTYESMITRQIFGAVQQGAEREASRPAFQERISAR